MKHHLDEACVLIYAAMGLYAESVELALKVCTCTCTCVHTYGTSHKKVSTVTPYVTLLDHYLFSTYNSITCVLRLMLSVHTHAYYEVRIRYGIQYAQHVACKLSVQREGRGAKA